MTAEAHGSVPAAPREGVHDSRLAALVDSLARARRRSGLRLFINGLVTSVAIGLAIFVGLELLHSLLGGLAPILSFDWMSVPAWFAEWRPAPVPQHLTVALAGGIAALIVAQFAAAAGRPGIGRLARAADREYAMEERLSTALQLARAPGARSNVVREALLQDAARHAAEVDARRLIPIRLGWQALSVPVLAVIAVLIVNSPPAPILAGSAAERGTQGQLVGGPPGFTQEERAAAAGEIRAIAAILARDGEARSDPVLQAVAAELNALGNELAANPNLNRTAVGDQLQRLAEAAQGAYERAGVGVGANENYAQLVDDALRAIDPGRYQVEEATEEPLDPLQAAANDNAFDFGTVAEGNVPIDEGGILLPEGPQNAATANINVAEGTNVPAELNHEWDNPYEEYSEADFAVNPEVEVIGLGEGVGGNLAGIGAAELGGGFGGPIAPGATEGEMMLVDPDPGNGRMIQLNLPPLDELMAVNTEGLETGIWRPLEEREVTRTAVPANDLAAVGRYFQAIMAERDE